MRPASSLWLIPLVVVSGGPSAYWRAFFNQGAEDLTGVAMLATTPSSGSLVQTLQHSFLAPWGYWQLAAAVLVLAPAGVVQSSLVAAALGARSRWRARSVRTSCFDLLFQETVTTRYALPLVVPVAYLAVRGVHRCFREALAVAAAIALGVTVGRRGRSARCSDMAG